MELINAGRIGQSRRSSRRFLRSGVVVILCLLPLADTLALGAETGTNAAHTNLFKSHLPVIQLTSKEAIVSDRKVSCTVRLILPGQFGKSGVLSGLVRIHGASSQGYAKKSYGLTLDAPVAWLGMREDEHWVLNAAFVDRSLMRHKLSYDSFRSMSGRGAPRHAAASRFVELQRNGEYDGVYLLMERVNRALLGLARFDSNATSHACVYKAVDHAANFSQAGHGGYEQRQPDPQAKEYWAPLDEFNAFVSGATETEFFDPHRGISMWLDLDNAIDFQLLVLLTSNMDGITKNFILARDAPKPGAPAPRFFFAPWDYDATFGRNWEASRVAPDAWLSNHLFERLHSNVAFRRQLAARWKQLRTAEFSVSAIHRLIDENARTLGDAAARNAARWRTLDGPYPDRLTFEEDVAQMKAWVAARVDWLDVEIARRAQ